jgi:hypothetical protein
MMTPMSKRVSSFSVTPFVVDNDIMESVKSLNVNLEQCLEHNCVSAFPVVLKHQPLSFGEELRPPV